MSKLRNWINYQGIQNRYAIQTKNLTESLRYFCYSFIAAVVISKEKSFNIGSIKISDIKIEFLFKLCIIYIILDIFQYIISMIHNFVLSLYHRKEMRVYLKSIKYDKEEFFKYDKDYDYTEYIFELDKFSVFIYEIFLPIIFFVKVFIAILMIIAILFQT